MERQRGHSTLLARISVVVKFDCDIPPNLLFSPNVTKSEFSDNNMMFFHKLNKLALVCILDAWSNQYCSTHQCILNIIYDFKFLVYIISKKYNSVF